MKFEYLFSDKRYEIATDINNETGGAWYEVWDNQTKEYVPFPPNIAFKGSYRTAEQLCDKMNTEFYKYKEELNAYLTGQ